MEFRNLSELNNYLLEAIQFVMVNEVAEKVRQVEHEEVESKVYEVYPDPKIYRRRRDNFGLSDIRNMKASTLRYGKNTIELKIENVTQSNLDFLPDGQESHFIASDVEYGLNYNYRYEGGSKYQEPRRFTLASIERLKNRKEHIEAFKKGLGSKGIKVG